MSDSKNENHEPEGREIYFVSIEKVLWISTAGSNPQDLGSYKVHFDEDGNQIRAEWWRKGKRRYNTGTIYIKDNQVLDERDFNRLPEKYGWEPLSMS